jgi:hypothetical protein
MGRRWLLLGVLLLFSIQACGRRGPAGEDPAVRSALRPLRTGVITRLEILYLPKEIMTVTNLGPEQLEKLCYYRISVDHFDQSKLKRDLLSVLEHSDMREATGPYPEPDCRWGCIFYNEAGGRVLTMYFDGPGVKGLIGKTPVALRRTFGKLAMVRLLESRCSCLWE